MFVDNGFTWQDHLDHSNKDISTQNFTQKYLSKPPKRTNSLPPPKNFPIVTRSLPEKTTFQTKKILHLLEKLNSYTRVEKLKRLISVVF